LRVVESERYEFDEWPLGGVTSWIGLPDRRWAGVGATAAKQGEEIRFEDKAEDQENDRAADADVQAAELESSASAAFIATVLDILALATGSPSHGFLLRKKCNRAGAS
jgi:hypothetical protein